MAGDWSLAPLGEVSINHDALRVPVKEANRKSGPFPYYGASGVVDHVDGYLFQGEYLLIAEDGENLRTRQTPVAFMATGRFWVNNHAHILTGNSQALTRFLHYALAVANIEPFLTGAVMPKLTQSNLNRISVPLPTLREQHKIVELLGTLDDKIQLNRRMAESLEAIGQAFFSSWFVGFDPVRAKGEGRSTELPGDLAGLFPDSFDDDGLPEGWAEGTIANLATVNPITPLKADIAPYIDMAALPTSGPRVTRVLPRAPGSGARFRNGDTLIARITPCLENGKTALVDRLDKDAVGWGSTEFIVLRPNPDTPKALPYLLARHQPFRDALIAAMTGTSGRQRVQADAVTRWPLALPTKQVLEAFKNITGPIFDRITRLGEESATLAKLRDTILPKLISGELRIADADAQVSAA